MCDRAWLPLATTVSAANVNDHLRLEETLDAVPAVRQPIGRPRKRPGKLHADKGYDYRPCRQLLKHHGITARIARRGVDSSTRLGRHRYVIERCLQWITRFRRLTRRYERHSSHFAAFLAAACALICYRRATRLNLLATNNPK